jgi:GT2 family glycosyltransferase
MKVALVILNWNGMDLLKEFLPSVIEYSEDRANIFIVDNASDDDSVLWVESNFPTVNIIRNGQNGGFAKGYNDSLSLIDEPLLILMNNDVEVTPNWLDPIIKEFEHDVTLVAAQPKILDQKKKDHFEYAGAAGGFIDRLGYPYCRGRIFDTVEKDTGQYDGTHPIFWATGACLAVRKDAFLEVGGFDEDLFTHQEEIDLCWRLQAIGGVVKFIGSSAVYHVGGATLPSANPKKTFYNFRNTLLVLLKNVNGTKVWFLIFIRLILDGFAGILFLIQGKPEHVLSIIRSHLSFYALIPAYLKKRRNIGNHLKYYHINSVVWKYYVLKKRLFKEL